MSDNPFDDLAPGDTEVSEEDSETEANKETGGQSVSDLSVSGPESTERSTQASTSESTSDDGDHLSGPAFEYAEVRQRPLYARGATWDAFEDAIGITIVPTLRKEGIRDEEIRELHDAALRLAVEEPERVADLLIEARRRS